MRAEPAAPEPRKVVAITGATGFVGSLLAKALCKEGAVVRVLTRDVAAARRKLPSWDYGPAPLQFFNEADWTSGVRGATHVVNLAGEPISSRWTPAVKQAILHSRVNATNRLVAALRACAAEERPGVMVSASAVGFYGSSASARFDESSSSGSDYLSSVCREWEAAAAPAAEELGARLVVLRMGIVLDRGGGALAKMAPVFQIFAGGPLGDGRQWFSWIHRDDAVGILMKALSDDSVVGVYNATAPRPVRMNELCNSLGAVMGRPAWLPVPEFAIQALLGEGAKVVLEGQQVLPTRTLGIYSFKYETVTAALRQVVGGAAPR